MVKTAAHFHAGPQSLHVDERPGDSGASDTHLIADFAGAALLSDDREAVRQAAA